jgi:hypothetical protein
MPKKRKAGGQPKKSESALITERARKLPLYTCYINEHWKESGMAWIIVTRQHVNGNLTIGFYQIDLLLKGVKDAFSRFNIPKYSFEEDLRDREIEFVETDYNLVHNIIYGAVAYAEDYGFYPCREWKVAQYVLKEDTDDIPLIEIEFGKDGKPTIFDLDSTYERDLKILEKTAGPGNFNFITGIDDDSEDEDETKVIHPDLSKTVSK